MRADFAVGDRILFSGDHPWSGHVGVEPMSTSVGDGWSVEVEGQAGIRACAFTDAGNAKVISKNEGRNRIP